MKNEAPVPLNQQHLVIVRQWHSDSSQHRARIRNQDVNFVLGDQLVVQRTCGRRIALVIAGNQFDRDFFVEGFDENATAGILLFNPELQLGIPALIWQRNCLTRRTAYQS